MKALVGFKDGRRFAWFRWRFQSYHMSVIRMSLRRLQLVAELSAMLKWVAWARQQTLFRRIARKLRHWPLQHAWRGWISGMEHLNDLRKTIVALRDQRYRPFSHWRLQAEMIARHMHHLHWALRRIMRPRLLMGFISWREGAFQLRRRRQVQLKAIGTMYNSHMRAGWNSWAAAVQESTRAIYLGTRSIAAMRNVALRRGFTSMVEALSASISAAQWADSVEIRMRFLLEPEARTFEACFRDWMKWALRRARLLELAVRMDKREIFGPFEVWLYLVYERHLMAQTVVRMFNQRCARALAAWIDLYSAILDARESLQVALNRWRRSGLLRSWNQWSALTQVGYELTDAARLLVGRLYHRSSGRAWTKWQECVSARSLLRRAAMAMRSASSRRALNAWLARAAARRANLARLERVLRVIRSGPRARAAFKTWAETERLDLMPPSVRRAVLRVKCGPNIGLAFNTWADMAATVRLRAATARRLLYRRQWHALRTWQGQSQARARAIAQLRKSVLRAINGAKARGWNKWQAESAALASVRWVRRHVHNYLYKRHMSRGFATWLEHSDAHAYFEQQVEHVLRRMAPRARALSRAFNSWSASFDALMRMRAALLTMRCRGLRYAMRTWRVNVAIADVEENAIELRRVSLARKLRMGASSMLNHRLRHGFNELKAASEESAMLARISRASAILIGGFRALKPAEDLADDTPEGWAARNRVLAQRVLHAWARTSVDWREHLRRHAEKARGSLRGVSHLLTPVQRANWPNVWKELGGWANDVMTWREATAWLIKLRIPIPNVSSSARPDGLREGSISSGIANAPAATRLLAACRKGHVYHELLERVAVLRHEHEIINGLIFEASVKAAMPVLHGRVFSTPRNDLGSRQRDAPVATGTATMAWGTPRTPATRAPPASRNASAPVSAACWQLGDGRVLRGERFWLEDDTWRERLHAFFRSADAFEALGASCRGLSIGPDGGKAVEHLAALSALRVVLEMSQMDKWSRFVDTLSSEHLANPRRVRLPRFTGVHPRDDDKACPAGAARNFVCLGCPTPRILLENLRCGKCDMKATTTIEDYLHVSAVPSAYYVVGSKGEARAGQHRPSIGSMMMASPPSPAPTLNFSFGGRVVQY